MDIATITEEPQIAQRKLKAYKTQLHRRANQEYEQIARGYRELAKGRALINLSEVVSAGGSDQQGRPNLAVARADRRQVRFRPSWGWSRVGFFDTMVYQRTEPGTLRVAVTLPESSARRSQGYALVPLVPADVVEEVGGRLHLPNHFVLWEVEQWSDSSLAARPDRDPYLLKHLGGDLYAVMAAWDLTPLERAVMAGRVTA